MDAHYNPTLSQALIYLQSFPGLSGLRKPELIAALNELEIPLKDGRIQTELRFGIVADLVPALRGFPLPQKGILHPDTQERLTQELDEAAELLTDDGSLG